MVLFFDKCANRIFVVLNAVPDKCVRCYHPKTESRSTLAFLCHTHTRAYIKTNHSCFHLQVANRPFSCVTKRGHDVDWPRRYPSFTHTNPYKWLMLTQTKERNTNAEIAYRILCVAHCLSSASLLTAVIVESVVYAAAWCLYGMLHTLTLGRIYYFSLWNVSKKNISIFVRVSPEIPFGYEY